MPKPRSLLAACALLGTMSQAAAAQKTAAAEFSLVVVDGVKLPYVPGLLDSLSQRRYVVDSTTTPHRARITTGTYTPSGDILVPLWADVAWMDTVRPARAIALYGDVAAMGAIVVTTKLAAAATAHRH